MSKLNSAVCLSMMVCVAHIFKSTLKLYKNDAFNLKIFYFLYTLSVGFFLMEHQRKFCLIF